MTATPAQRRSAAENARRLFTKHGMFGTPEYTIWGGMINRVRHKSYARRRGIGVCLRWERGADGKTGFECFYDDLGPRPTPAHSIDRINNNGNYEPGNVRWATSVQQGRNRTITYVVRFDGREMPLAEAVNVAGNVISYNTAWQRINSLGWSVQEAVTRGRYSKRHSLAELHRSTAQ